MKGRTDVRDSSQEAFDLCCRWCVTMDYRYVGQAGAPASPIWGIASAFILLVADRWILFTAGHVIQDLKFKMSQGAQIDKWRLNDGLAGSGHLSVPFDPELEKWHLINDQERGIDLAFTELRPLYAHQLYAGGITPPGSDWWFDGLPHECSTWLIFGTPDESVRRRPDGGAIANPALIPADPIAEVPKNGLAIGAELGPNLVYANVRDIPPTPGGIVVRNLDGM